VVVNTFWASYLAEGSISYLYYADRLLEFPMGVFAIAIATAVLPALSEETARGNFPAVKETLSFALRLTFFVILPAMVGLIVLRYPILNLLFQRGAFTEHSTEMTAQALFYYALGLAAFAGVRILVPVFYSLQDTRTPVKVAFLSLLANASLGAVLMIPLKHGGLALASSIAAGVNFTVLATLLRKKIGPIGAARILRSFGKNSVASILMGLTAYFVCLQGQWTSSGITGGKIGLLSGAIGMGILVYGGVCYLLGSDELHGALGLFKKGFGRRRLIKEGKGLAED
jgi:putative peptidoglycan lipid II flippase